MNVAGSQQTPHIFLQPSPCIAAPDGRERCCTSRLYPDFKLEPSPRDPGQPVHIFPAQKIGHDFEMKISQTGLCSNKSPYLPVIFRIYVKSPINEFHLLDTLLNEKTEVCNNLLNAAETDAASGRRYAIRTGKRAPSGAFIINDAVCQPGHHLSLIGKRQIVEVFNQSDAAVSFYLPIVAVRYSFHFGGISAVSKFRQQLRHTFLAFALHHEINRRILPQYCRCVAGSLRPTDNNRDFRQHFFQRRRYL